MNERFETFTATIAKINRNVRRLKNQEMAEYDLRGPQISCLYYLYTEGPLTATDLCERCEEDKATISRTLEFLAQNGYITADGSARRYKRPLLLTDSGKEVGEKIAQKVSRVLDEVGMGMTDAERTEFYRCLKIISDSLDAIVRASSLD